jgi:hypothetical protein
MKNQTVKKVTMLIVVSIMINAAVVMDVPLYGHLYRGPVRLTAGSDAPVWPARVTPRRCAMGICPYRRELVVWV